MSDTVNVAAMSVFAGNDVTTCGGNAITLTATVIGNSGPYTVLWQPGAFTTNPIGVFPSTTTTYTVTITDTASGCTATDSVTVFVFLTQALILPIPAVCDASPAFSLAPYGSPVGGVFTGSFVTGNTFDPITAGIGSHLINYTYTDPVTGCVRTDTAFVNVIPCCPPASAGITTANNQLSSSFGSSFAPAPTPVFVNGVFIVDNNFPLSYFI